MFVLQEMLRILLLSVVWVSYVRCHAISSFCMPTASYIFLQQLILHWPIHLLGGSFKM